MIEIQCTSCHTRYRLDERVLPEDTPTFKCSRCGHVFSAEPRGAQRPTSAKESIEPKEKEADVPHRPAPRVSTLKTGAPAHPSPRSGESAAPAEPPKASPPEPPQPSRTSRPTPPPRTRVAPAPDSPSSTQLSSGAERSQPMHGPDADQPDAGENLSFDFDDAPTLDLQVAPAPPAERDHDNWQVGDDQADFSRHKAIRPAPSHEAQPLPSAIDDLPLGDDDAPFFTARETAPSRAPYAPESGRIRSTGFILGIFVLFVLAFGGSTVLIGNAPIASAEFLNRVPILGARFAPAIVPARLVALRNVAIAYRTIKGGRALVVTGTAMNVGNTPLHAVQLAATLQDGARRPMAGATSYCGNNLAPTMVSEMTPRELEFFQQLQPPKSFVLKPLAAAPFAVVFVNPPAASDVSLAVAKAVPAAPEDLAAEVPAD